jgi:hypothetical protein
MDFMGDGGIQNRLFLSRINIQAPRSAGFLAKTTRVKSSAAVGMA